MKIIFNYLLKNFDKKNEIEIGKAKLLLILAILNIILITILTITYVFKEEYQDIINNVISLILYSSVVILVQKGKLSFAGNFFSIIISIIISLSVIFNFEQGLIYSYFLNGFYLFLFAIVFSAMFASRIVFVGTFVVMLLSSIITYNNTYTKLPDYVVGTANSGIITYFLVMIMIFVLTYFFTEFMNKSIAGLSEKSKKIENQNMVMQKMIAGIKKSSNEIAGASHQLSSISQQMTQSTNEQASTTEEISSSMEEMLATINSNTEKADNTSKITTKAAQKMEHSKQMLIQTLDSVNQINDKTSIISIIADKTDVLSINAAIEAARAGEAGKGFAVVAQEIRKLADKTTVASEEIGELSKTNQNISQVTSTQIEKVIPEITKSAELVNNIVSSSREQQAGVEAINASIQQLAEITNQNSSSAEEMSTSAEELSAQAEQLKELISVFKIADQYKLAANTTNETKHEIEKPKIQETKTPETDKGFKFDFKNKGQDDNNFETY